MTSLEVIERCNTAVSPARIYAYIQDALNEIQTKAADQVSREFKSVEADVRYYAQPTTMVKLDGVFAKDPNDSTKWVRILRIQKNDMLEDSDTSTSSSDDNIIIV